MTHTWDPDRYLTYADERGRPFVELVARIGADDPATVVDLGCGPGNLTRLLAERWPDADVLGVDSSPEMIDGGAGGRAGIGFEVADLRDWAGRRGDAGRRTRLQRHAPVGARPPRPAARAWSSGSRPAAGSPSRCPATSTSPATPSAPSSPPRRRTPSTPPASPCPTATTRPTTSTRCAGLGCDGRRLGDDVPPRAHRRRTRSSPGSPAPAPGRRSRRCPTTCGRSSRRSSSARLRDGLPGPRRTASCCRSAGSSSVAQVGARHEAPPRPGRLPARRRGRRAAVLRRRARADRGREAGGPARPRRRLVPGVRRRRRGRGRGARRRRGPVRAGPQGAPRAAARRRRRARGDRRPAGRARLRGRLEPARHVPRPRALPHLRRPRQPGRDPGRPADTHPGMHLVARIIGTARRRAR